MLHRRNPVLSRFSNKSKDQLVAYMNVINNRALLPEQLIFGQPTLVDGSGLSEVTVGFATSTGWDTAHRVMVYNRVDLAQVLNNEPLVIHVKDHLPKTIYDAIFEQYGIYLEMEFTELSVKTRYLNDTFNVVALDGFLPEDLRGNEAPKPLPDAYADNRNYTLKFKDNHLIFFGEVQVLTRRSMELLGVTFDSKMDLRAFYSDGNFKKPPADVYLPQGELALTDVALPYAARRQYESQLYEIVPNTLISNVTPLAPLLRLLTGDPWHSTPEVASEFNLYGSYVLHNGFVDKHYVPQDPAYNFLLAFELGDVCSNLTGIVKIAYRYSSSKTPGNLPYDHGGTPPILSR